MNLDRITLDSLEEWWTAHPEDLAYTGNACHCIVSVPLLAVTGLPASFCPNDIGEAHLWRWDTKEHQMTTINHGTLLVRAIPVGEGIDELATTFDGTFTLDGYLDGTHCVELIREIRKGLEA